MIITMPTFEELARLIDDDDRDWFEDRPKRLFRARFKTEGDHCAGKYDFILVFCPADGFRFRAPLGCLFVKRDVCDGMLFASFDVFLDRIERTNETRSLAKALRRVMNACRDHGGRLPQDRFRKLFKRK